MNINGVTVCIHTVDECKQKEFDWEKQDCILLDGDLVWTNSGSMDADDLSAIAGITVDSAVPQSWFDEHRDECRKIGYCWYYPRTGEHRLYGRPMSYPELRELASATILKEVQNMRILDLERDARQLVQNAITDNGNWEPYEPWEGEKSESYYLGTVFAIMPSGKYYMPWACSNVDPCPRCEGKGCDFCDHSGSREAHEDECFMDALEKEAGKYNCWVESGEGDPCDLFLGRLLI